MVLKIDKIESKTNENDFEIKEKSLLSDDQLSISSKNSERSTPALNQLIEEEDKISYAPTESVAASVTETIISKYTVHSTNTMAGQTSNEHWV